MKKVAWMAFYVVPILFGVAYLVFHFECSTFRLLVVRSSIELQLENPSVEVKLPPVIQTEDFNIYEAAYKPGEYFVTPTRLHVIASESGDPLATALERADAGYLIFSSSLGPDTNLLDRARSQLTDVAINFSKVDYYPASHINVRSLTDPKVPSNILFTVVAARSSPTAPFHLVTIIQITDRQSVVPFKQLVKLNAGVIFEMTYEMSIVDEGQRAVQTRTANAIISNVDVTNSIM